MDAVRLDPSRVSTHIIDPSISYQEDVPFHCNRCGKWLFSTNRRFALSNHGGILVAGIPGEIPLNIFRMTRFCGQCRTYHIIYLDLNSEVS